jgi:hypothetical protein
MERPLSYTPVKCDGKSGWKLPYPYGVLPSSGSVVAVDPAGVTRLISRKLITKH